MADGATIGLLIEIIISASVGIWFIYLHFNPEKQKVFVNLPLLGNIFKFKYSFLIVGIICFLDVILKIKNYLI